MKRLLAILVSVMMIIGMALPVLASPFSDLPDDHWASDAVKMLSALGIIQGYPDGLFKGRNQATRYEVALMVARALEYLDRDIRDLTERLNQIDGKSSPAEPVAKAGEDGTVVLQTPAPDATILEQVIAEKIAGMSQAQWEEFDDRLSALLARIDDLSESNKAEHAALWKALEALGGASAGGAIVAAGSDEELLSQLELALLQQKAELMMAFYDSIAAANDERDRMIADVEARFEQSFLDQQAALMAAFYDVLDAYKDGHELDHAALEAKWEQILNEQAAPLDSKFKESLAELRDEVSLALLEQKAELTMAFYDSIQALRDEYEQKFQALGEQWDVALLEQKAELTMAFYDSIQALRDENEQKFAAIEENWERALLEQKAELTMAFYDSIQALRDANEQEFAAIEENWELALLEQKAELTMAFYDSIEAVKDEYEQRFTALEEKWELALLEQKAELTMSFYDSIEAERDARIHAMDELAAQHDQDLIDAKAEMAAAIYDALEAVRGEFAIEIDAVMAVVEALRSDFDTELKALGARIDAVDAALNLCIVALEAEVADVRALADQNAFDIIDTYHKLKTEDIAPLAARVDHLEESTAVAHAKIQELRDDFGKVRITGSDELKFVDIDLDGEVGAKFYKDPFKPASGEHAATSQLKNTLLLKLALQPREGVNIDIGLKALTDIFGGPATLGLFSGDIDVKVTTEKDVTKAKIGTLSRPGNFTDYQMGAAKFADSAVRGISADYTRGGLNATGMIAKIKPLELDFQYVLGAGARYELSEKLTLGARGLKIQNDAASGGVYGEGAALEEEAFGGDFALNLTENFGIQGEASLWKNSKAPEYLTAYNVGAQGKLGFLNIEASHEQVAKGYAPKYLDPKLVEADTCASSLTVTTDKLKGFVITGEAGREGDADYDEEDATMYGAGVKYFTKLMAADLTLRGGVDREDTKLPVENAGVVTTTQLGFDVAYKPVEAGFTWEREIESKTVGYIGYAKADIPFGEAVKLKGDWEQRFGSREYYKYNAGLFLSLPVVADKVTVGAEASYGKASGATHPNPAVADTINYAKWLMKGDVAWQIAPTTKATGMASYEVRNYEAADQRSGAYLQVGLGVGQELFKATSLNLNYNVKDVRYSAEENIDYGVRILELSLKTAF
jgi:NifU-like protein involved in Fe-S cluster formation